MIVPLASYALAIGLGLTPSPDARQIAIETRLLTVPMKVADELGAGAGLKPGSTSVVLDGAKARSLLEMASVDRSVNVLAAPKVTTLEGQRAEVMIGGERSYVTGVDVAVKDGMTVGVPKTESVFVGFRFACTARAAEDGKALRLAVESCLSSVPTMIPVTPVTYMATPVYEGGSQGQPIPFTQFIQEVRVQKQSASAGVDVPDGGAVLLDAGTRTVETRTESGVPVLSKVPYVSRLFKNVAYGRETQRTFLIVTARVLEHQPNR